MLRNQVIHKTGALQYRATKHNISRKPTNVRRQRSRREHEARRKAAHEALFRCAQQYEARLRRMKRKRLK
ncbi:MAG: hypothetical protein J6S21_02130, partial [Victivallales bacterium]|nr:hypothetical protein [Victivallales bacterium]